MIWVKQHGADKRIVHKSDWASVNSHSMPIPEKDVEVILILADRDFDVRYVGKVLLKNLVQELGMCSYSWKGHGATRYTWLAAKTKEDTETLLNDLIRVYDPPNNTRTEPKEYF